MLQIYFVCLTYLLIVTDVVRCKPDYLFNYETGGWFKLHIIPAPWEVAFLRCHYEGTVLASPLDPHLTNALHTVMSQFGVNSHIYLGTHDWHSEGDFFSVEGVPLSDMDIRWGSSDKEAHPGDCLTMSIDGHAHYMYLSSCTKPLPFICYRKHDNRTLNECGTFDDAYYLNRRTGSCYKVHEEKQDWPHAFRICAAEGGYLVILNDKEEARIIKDMFPISDGEVDMWDGFLTGLRAWGNDRTWITIHGERIEDVFHDWHPGQPDNYGGYQSIASFIRPGTLDDQKRNDKSMFVCEKSPTAIRFEAPPPCRHESTKL